VVSIENIKMKWFKRYIDPSFVIPEIPKNDKSGVNMEKKGENMEKKGEKKDLNDNNDHVKENVHHNTNNRQQSNNQNSNNQNRNNQKKSRPNLPLLNVTLNSIVLFLSLCFFLIGGVTFFWLSLCISLMINLMNFRSTWRGDISFNLNMFSLLMKNPNIQNLFYCIIFLCGPPNFFCLIPPFIIFSIPVATYINNIIIDKKIENSNLRLIVEKLRSFVDNQELVLFFVAYCETIQTFIIIFNIFLGYSNIFVFITYLNFLKQRYLNTPYTKNTMFLLGQYIQATIKTYVPSLLPTYLKVIEYIKMMFLGAHYQAKPTNQTKTNQTKTNQPIITEPDD